MKNKSVSFDIPKLKRLKIEYKKANAASLNQFTFEGQNLDFNYAKYLIEYLESQFRLKEKIKP